MVGGSLEALGIPHKWLSEAWKKTPPWEARGEPMFGPVVRLWKAGKHGETYHKYGPKEVNADKKKK